MEIDKTLESAAASVPSLSLTVENSLLTAFYELLQAGFRVRCKVGVSIESLFYEQAPSSSMVSPLTILGRQ